MLPKPHTMSAWGIAFLFWGRTIAAAVVCFRYFSIYDFLCNYIWFFIQFYLIFYTIVFDFLYNFIWFFIQFYLFFYTIFILIFFSIFDFYTVVWTNILLLLCICPSLSHKHQCTGVHMNLVLLSVLSAKPGCHIGPLWITCS